MSVQIPTIERSRIQALVAGRMELLWQLHAPDYQLITPSGRTFTRDRYLGDIEAGRLRYLRWDAGPMDVRVCGQMALVRYRATLELDAGNGRGTPFQCWHNDSYELADELWQAVWSQATAIK
ncbi:MAG TPA: nuclear transport factor 2 family protein [Burkholderiaceae bacterium]|nr:nuclear transport factor 2 family protein [Burkholderiaceae bacterium]